MSKELKLPDKLNKTFRLKCYEFKNIFILINY